MKNRLTGLLLFLCSMCAGHICLAQTASTNIRFSAARIPLHLEADHTGFLVELHRWLMDQAGIEVPLIVVPLQRAKYLLESQQVQGFYPSWIPDHYRVDVLFSAPLMQIDHYIFSLKGGPVYSDIRALSGRRLGVVRGYKLNLDFAHFNVNVVNAVNSRALVSMLLGGRVDAIVLSLNEVQLMQSLSDTPDLAYNSDHVLVRKYLGYCFLNNPEGVKLQQNINRAILKARESGELYKRFPQLTALARQ